jgi:hypothetical protein
MSCVTTSNVQRVSKSVQALPVLLAQNKVVAIVQQCLVKTRLSWWQGCLCRDLAASPFTQPWADACYAVIGLMQTNRRGGCYAADEK